MQRRGRYTCVNPRDPRAAGVCDRGGEVRKRSELIREQRWAGNRLVATGFLVCREHLDMPHPQDRVLILRPDPVPVRDPRPVLDLPPPITPAAGPALLGVSFILGQSELGA